MDEVPLLIPIQPVEAQQGGQENHVEEDALTMPVEEVIQNVQHQVAVSPVAEEQVLAMDDDTDTDSEVFPQAQLPVPLVEIVPFLDFNNLQPLMPKEIQVGDLMGWINDQGNVFEHNEDIQLGMV